MRILGDKAGVSKLKVLIVLAVLGLGFNEGIKYLSVQLDYQRMKDAMAAKASVAQVLKDDEIIADLAGKAKELGLPLAGENFLLTRDIERRTMTIRTAWDVEVHYLWGLCGGPCIRTYHFEPVAEESYVRK
jgi:hypothetical protein